MGLRDSDSSIQHHPGKHQGGLRIHHCRVDYWNEKDLEDSGDEKEGALPMKELPSQR